MSSLVSGVLLVDKPAGESSAKVIAKIRKHFNVKKIGHGGTLDPFATGLMIVFFNEATKISRFFLGGEKTYIATALQGWETDTGDCDGKPKDVKAEPASFEQWQNTRLQFMGTITQIPPMFSALKHKGKKYYEYARAGIEIERKERTATITQLELLQQEDEYKIKFMVQSSGGTYIRTLAEDWAKAAGTLAHLVGLRRTKVKEFSIENAFTLEQLLNMQNAPLLTIPQTLAHIPQFECPKELKKGVLSGNHKSFLALRSSNAALFAKKPESLLLTYEQKPLALIQQNAKVEYAIERVFNLSH